MEKPNKVVVIVAAVFPLLSAIIYMWIKPFDGIEFNGDSYRYYLSALRLVESLKSLTIPEPAFWPDGYPILLASVFQFADVSFKNAQWVNICLTSLMSLTLYFIFYNSIKDRANFNPIFIFSIVIFYFCGFILKYQLTLMSDLPALFWSVLTAFFLFRFLEKRKLLLIVAVSLSVAMAIMTRYVYALLFIPIAAALFVEFRNIRLTILYLIIIGFGVFIFSSPQIFLILQSPDSSLNHPWISRWSIVNFWLLDRSSIDGNLTVSLPNFLYYFLIPFRHSEFTPAGFILFLGGVFISFRNGLNNLTIFFLVWFCAIYLFLCGILIQNPRFCLSLYIPILYFIFMFLQFLFHMKFKRFIYAGLFLFVAVKIFTSTAFVNQTINEKDNMLASAEKFSAMIPKETVIITWDFFEAYYIYFPDRQVETIHNLTIEKVDEIVRHSSVVLIFDENRLNSVWKNFPPAELYQQIVKKYPFRKLYDDGKYSVLLGGTNEK